MSETLIVLSRTEIESLVVFVIERTLKETLASSVRSPQKIADRSEVTPNSGPAAIDSECAQPTARHLSRKPVNLLGQEWGNHNDSARKQTASALRALYDLDLGLMTKLANKKGRKRPYVARSREALYPGRPDLASEALEFAPGWWVGTNRSRREMRSILRCACDIAGLVWGTDLVVEGLEEVTPPSRPIPRLEDL